MIRRPHLKFGERCSKCGQRTPGLYQFAVPIACVIAGIYAVEKWGVREGAIVVMLVVVVATIMPFLVDELRRNTSDR
jgi:hypothetical protein